MAPNKKEHLERSRGRHSGEYAITTRERQQKNVRLICHKDIDEILDCIKLSRKLISICVPAQNLNLFTVHLTNFFLNKNSHKQITKIYCVDNTLKVPQFTVTINIKKCMKIKSDAFSCRRRLSCTIFAQIKPKFVGI